MSIKRFFREELIKKVIATEVRLSIMAGLANIEPPIGPTISQFGINATEFCNRFNLLSSLYSQGSIQLIVLVRKQINDFSLIIKGAISSGLLKNQCVKVRNNVRLYLFSSDIFLVSKFKFLEYLITQPTNIYLNIRSFSNSLMGTARSINCTILLE